MRVTVSEIRPGLAVHLDTDLLRRLGGSSTNAEVSNGNDRAVEGPHYFLITAVDRESAQCTAVPLFSVHALGNEQLDPAKKAGSMGVWQRQDSYFSRWQHWRIPLSSIEAASGDEFTDPSNRCLYCPDDPVTLDGINAWIEKNRVGFRVL